LGHNLHCCRIFLVYPFHGFGQILQSTCRLLGTYGWSIHWFLPSCGRSHAFGVSGVSSDAVRSSVSRLLAVSGKRRCKASFCCVVVVSCVARFFCILAQVWTSWYFLLRNMIHLPGCILKKEGSMGDWTKFLDNYTFSFVCSGCSR
jgi:hypothetical protein